jgi:glycosyltransferase involved in cell wall biosynthesis
MNKVCHITSAHPRKDTRIFLKQLLSLKDEGYKCFQIVADGLGDGITENIQILDAGNYRNKRLMRIVFGPRKILKKAFETDAEIFHLHDPELLRISGSLLKHGKKVIYDAHEDLPRQILSKHWIPRFLRKSVSKWVERFENKKAARVSAVITATAFIRDRFLKINPRTIDVNNFPDVSIFSHPVDNNSADGVCYVGGLSVERGISELVSATEIANCKLHLAGNFIPEDFKAKAEAIKGWENVKFYGVIEKKQIIEIFSKSYAGVVPLHPLENYKDALPVKMFEYMAAGLPVIASDFPLWKKILEENECGITVNPLSPDAIAKAIQYFGSHPSEAKRMGLNGRKAVETKFNWAIEKQKLFHLYNQLLIPKQ